MSGSVSLYNIMRPLPLIIFIYIATWVLVNIYIAQTSKIGEVEDDEAIFSLKLLWMPGLWAIPHVVTILLVYNLFFNYLKLDSGKKGGRK